MYRCRFGGNYSPEIPAAVVFLAPPRRPGFSALSRFGGTVHVLRLVKEPPVPQSDPPIVPEPQPPMPPPVEQVELLQVEQLPQPESVEPEIIAGPITSMEFAFRNRRKK